MGTAEASSGRSGRVIVVVAALAAFVVLVGWPMWDSAEYRPILDQAVHELRIRDVGTADQPFVGPASTGGMNHPGPLGFTVLAVPYHLLGGSSKGALVGAGAIAVLSAVASVAIVARVGGRRPAWVLAVAVALMLTTFGADRAFDVWNPNLALIPFLLVLVSVWAVTCGRVAVIPIAVVAASFVVQNHVAYAIPVAALGLWGVVGLMAAARRGRLEPGEPAAVGGWLLVALAVGVACWTLPVAQQVIGPDGNLSALADYSSGSAETAGISVGLEVLARHAGGVPTWVGAAETDGIERGVVAPASPWLLAIPAAGLGVAAVLGWRARRFDVLRLVVTVTVAGAAAVLAVSRIVGPILLHYVRWIWPVSLLGWVAVVWAVFESLPPRAGAAVDRWLRPVGIAAVVLIGTVGWFGRPPHPWPSPPREAELVALVDATMDSLPDDLAGPVLVESDGSLEGKKIHTALEAQLERRGVPVAVPDRDGYGREYGTHRAERRPAYRIEVTTGAAASAAVASGAEVQVLHRRSPGDGAPAVVVTLERT